MLNITLEIISILSVGIVAGSTFYSSMVEIPVRAKTNEDEQLKNWRLVFPKASGLLKTFGNITMISILATWYFTGNITWLFGAIPLFILIPFTAIFIAKTNAKIASLTNSVGVSILIKNWGKLHHVRTALAILSFIICVFAVVLNN